MSETAVMGKSEDRTPNLTQHVQVGSLRRQSQRGCGQCSLPIKARSAETGSGKKVSYRFHVELAGSNCHSRIAVVVYRVKFPISRAQFAWSTKNGWLRLFAHRRSRCPGCKRDLGR